MMNLVKVKKLVADAKLPEYAHLGDAGADIFSIDGYTVNPGERVLVKTGISIALPKNTEAQVRSKSGLAYKFGIVVLNSPGTVDEPYRGEVGVIIINHGDEPYVIMKGDKIAQLVIKPVFQATFNEVEELDETDRGQGGYGSTGK